MNAAMRIRARHNGGVTEVSVLMLHPTETGLRRDGTGALVAAHFISDLQVHLGERLVLAARLSQAMARDPLVTFRFAGGSPGEVLTVRWADNRGQQAADSARIS